MIIYSSPVSLQQLPKRGRGETAEIEVRVDGFQVAQQPVFMRKQLTADLAFVGGGFSTFQSQMSGQGVLPLIHFRAVRTGVE